MIIAGLWSNNLAECLDGELLLYDILINIIDLLEYCQEKGHTLYKNDKIYKYKNVHIALAVDTPRGLMVPVIQNCNMLAIDKVSQTIKDLANQCRDGSINPDFLSGGTFTITNLGIFRKYRYQWMLRRQDDVSHAEQCVRSRRIHFYLKFVIPAKAGIQCIKTRYHCNTLDSRFRGNDRGRHFNIRALNFELDQCPLALSYPIPLLDLYLFQIINLV